EPKRIDALTSMVPSIPARVVRLWDVEKGELAATLEAGMVMSNGFTEGSRFSQDGRTLFLVAGKGEPARYAWQRWDVSTRSQIAAWPDDISPPASTALSPDGRILAVASSAGCIRLWNLDT